MSEVKLTGVKIKGFIGTWYSIDTTQYKGKTVYLMEHETYGDEAESLIIDEQNNIIREDVSNGFDELYYDFGEDEE